ncbi:hypothetical protein, partial [Leclercia sp. M50]|uniref:hypothetical protein n=1 Tax=Leclercia sp. M50 TaxID=3081258 RepID=UPI00301ABC80
PPAFNLSHDQTLQFKFDARELNFVMNYVFTQRLGIHLLSEDIKNPCHFECPHRLSDKLLKSSATRLSLTVARSRILRFPHSESSDYFALFSAGYSSLNPADPAACVPLFRVSGGAL